MEMTWAQTRQICNAGLNVKIIGTHAGVDDGQDGTGHHATEDMAIARVIPQMTVLAPSDENEVRAAIKEMIAYPDPFICGQRENHSRWFIPDNADLL